MQGKVFVRLQMSCGTHIEFPFYSSNIGRPDICCHCTSPNAGKDENTMKTHRVVLPVCQNCVPKGIPKRMPKKMTVLNFQKQYMSLTLSSQFTF